ncbi:NADH-ubiquinone oxidoreductase B18 subunit-domain-containing protein [Gautieria morchelliformis]|nr:NADH-ubiquinone oxidoreductase B18 subunit-domain-containing protein [Gautieria morchelliformis]
MAQSASTAAQEELKTNKVPLGYRDGCSSLLIPLNQCRRKNAYVPWECNHERHAYELCQYNDFIRRTKELSKRKLQAVEAEET